jgi:cell wall-associated NlpC family hydrolase
MAPEALPVLVLLGNITVHAYQLASDNLCRLLLTHRQIGEPIGKTKASAQKFCKDHQQELPSTVTAVVPDKPRPVALSSWTAALAYWRHQAEAGNDTALALVEAAGNIAEQHLPIQVGVTVTSSDPSYPKDVEAAIAALPQGDSLPNSEELQWLDEGLNLISQWLATAGVGAGAIASWKLNVLADRFPTLGGAAADAQQLLGQNDTASSTGMIASQVAQMVSEKLGQPVSAAQVNTALHELELQDWTKPGSRERKLTPKGEKYGRAMLATSKTNAWSGAQLRWFDNVVPVLCEHFQLSPVRPT